MIRNKTLLTFSSLIVFAVTSCGGTDLNNIPSSMKIMLDGKAVDSKDVIVGDTDTFTLDLPAEASSVLETISWTSSDSNIVSIENNGRFLAKSYGTAIITAASSKYSSLRSSVFVNVKENVHQDGVGTGFTKDDPIFKGNEGSDEPVEIYFIEMRQMYEDCIYIKKGNVDILIDGGEAYDGKYASTFLKEKMGDDDTLDLLIATHGDSDHISGLPNALSNIKHISTIIDYGGIQNTPYSKKKAEFIEKGALYHTAYDCVNFTDEITSRYYLTSEFYVDILDTNSYCKNNESKSSNPYSVAALFSYKDFSFFTAGDLTKDSEESLMKKVDLPNVTLYKASHHGSHGSNTQAFMNKLNPKGVAISAAIPRGTYGQAPTAPSPSNNKNLNAVSGHPAAEAIERIYQIPNIMANLRVYWNAVNGTMCFKSHGENDFEFSGSPTMKGYYDLTKTNGVGEWDEKANDWKNKVTGEENLKFSETKAFKFRGYDKYLPH